MKNHCEVWFWNGTARQQHKHRLDYRRETFFCSFLGSRSGNTFDNKFSLPLLFFRSKFCSGIAASTAASAKTTTPKQHKALLFILNSSLDTSHAQQIKLHNSRFEISSSHLSNLILCSFIFATGFDWCPQIESAIDILIYLFDEFLLSRTQKNLFSLRFWLIQVDNFHCWRNRQLWLRFCIHFDSVK